MEIASLLLVASHGLFKELHGRAQLFNLGKGLRKPFLMMMDDGEGLCADFDLARQALNGLFAGGKAAARFFHPEVLL